MQFPRIIQFKGNLKIKMEGNCDGAFRALFTCPNKAVVLSLYFFIKEFMVPVLKI